MAVTQPEILAVTGNEAVAEAMGQIDPDVVCAYPITPQTEVVQLYVSDADATVTRPAQELMAFHKVWLEPGETEVVELHLDARSFAFWDVVAHGWTVEPGTFHLRVGSSSRDIRTTATITL